MTSTVDINRYVVDPFNITDFNRTEEQLQVFLMFCVAVAGKKAVMISKKINTFLCSLELMYEDLAIKRYGSAKPFDLLRVARDKSGMRYWIEHTKLGKTKVLSQAFTEFADWADSGLSLETISIDQLESVCGIGFKTSRFFLLHSRQDQKIAVLDTHLLHFLRDKGYDAPAVTPSSKQRYSELEAVVLKLAKKAKKSVADFDLWVWRKYTKTKPLVG